MTHQSDAWHIRDYTSGDETQWLRCRVLGFLDTAYYDDVFPRKPRPDHGVELVAVSDGNVVGICDASIDGEAGTIETIVVHPDYRRRGIAHVIADRTCQRLRQAGATTVDAWTREDPGTLAWYKAEGFVHQFRYLHVDASSPDEMVVAAGTQLGLMPRNGHFHAWEQEEVSLRAKFERVYGCNRFMKQL